jgi:hypothetical protein
MTGMQRGLSVGAAVTVAVFLLLGRGDAEVPSRPTLPPDVLYAMPGDLNYAYGPQGVVLQDVINHAPGAPFQVTYGAGFPPEAQAAFTVAAKLWTNAVGRIGQSNPTLRISASWTPMPANVLGTGAPAAACDSGNIFYSAAQARFINETGCGAPVEIAVGFNSALPNWDFGTSGTGAPGKYSFLTAALHEIAHGLGFHGAFTSANGTGSLASPVPYIFDTFAADASLTRLLAIPRPSAALHAQLTGSETFWVGPRTVAKLEAHNFDTRFGVDTSPHAGWLQGSSFLHLDYDLYAGTPNGLMVWALNSNTTYTDMGPLVRRMFTDMNWATVAPFPMPRAVPGDFDGDGFADLAVFRPSTGTWFIEGRASQQIRFGFPGDIPIPADYNKDGITDVAVYRPSASADGVGVFLVRGQGFRNGNPWGIPAVFASRWTTGFGAATETGAGATPAAYVVLGDGNARWEPGWPGWGGSVPCNVPLGLRGDIPLTADFNGDGADDCAVFRPSTGEWDINSQWQTVTHDQLGEPGDIPLAAQFDRDLKADIAVYRPSLGLWLLSMTADGPFSIQFGLPADVPVALDRDGDGVAELCLWRPATGMWYIYNRVTGAVTSKALGRPGDIAVMQRPQRPTMRPGDFDGDGRADPVVFRPSSGIWYIKSSETSFTTSFAIQWGLDGDVPVAGDYDGDRRSDLAVYRPSNGVWYLRPSAGGDPRMVQWGLPGDIPRPADYDADGRTDLAVYRPQSAVWYVLLSSTEYSTYVTKQWGESGDFPMATDINGDSLADFVFIRPSDHTWNFEVTPYIPPRSMRWGLDGDVPIDADFFGDGRANLAVYRPSIGQWLANDANSTKPFDRPPDYSVQLGLPTDIPVAQDYDGDGQTDPAVFRPSSGEWFFIPSSTGVRRVVQWGLPGDIPVSRNSPR